MRELLTPTKLGDAHLLRAVPDASIFNLISMYLIAIAWIYVTLMMAIAEATNTNGSILGAVLTFLLYGVGPTALLMYILGTPARKRKRRALEQAEAATSPSHQPDAGGQPATDAVAPVREIK